MHPGKSGRIGLDRHEWHKLSDEIKEFIKEYNAAVSHKEDVSSIKMPNNVKVQKARRTNKSSDKEIDNCDKKESTDDKKILKKKRIVFNLDSGSDDESKE